MSQSVLAQALLSLVVFGVSAAIGLFLAGGLGAAILGVLGLVVFATTLGDVEQTTES